MQPSFFMMMAKISLVFVYLTFVGDKISTLVKAAGLNVESYWPKLFAKAVEGQNIASFFSFGGDASSAASSGPAQPAQPAAK